jgi:putative transposase
MIDRRHELRLPRQAEVLELSRGSLYYEPRPVSVADLAIMRRMDELYLDYAQLHRQLVRANFRSRLTSIAPPDHFSAD